MDLKNMMKQVQDIQSRINSMQAELAEKTVETSSGGGMVNVIANGKQEIISINISPEIIDANDLWGLDTYQTDSAIQGKYGNCETARIGPAGENLVKYANILSGTKRISTNGRTGMGCVMGSKNLKAIIIKTSDNIEIETADKEAVQDMCKRYREGWVNAIWIELKKDYGTLQIMQSTRTVIV